MASEGFNDGSLVARRGASEREVRLSERVAVLETRCEETERLLHHALDKISAQGAELQRYKGFAGGFVLCVSVIGFVLMLFRAQIGAAFARLFK